MAYLHFPNLKISGISACVPKNVEENASFYNQRWGSGYEDFVATTGVERAHRGDASICTSDLCYEAAEKLIADLGWDKSEIEALVLVTQTPDYILPATSCILQDRLGLSKSCMALDISLGCSGWVYGLSVIAGLMSNGGIKKGLLLAGDTTSKHESVADKASWPLFGDAGTVTAIEYQEGLTGFSFNMNTDGSSYDAIIIPDGGCRHPFNEQSLILHEYEEGAKRTNLNCALDGMSVFSFGITKAPKSVRGLVEHFELNLNDIDLFLFHQANKFMNEKIRAKLGIPTEKVPYSMTDYGNTSSASIPLTYCSQNIANTPPRGVLRVIACGFGVGLSWGSVYFELENIVVPNIIEI